MNRLARITVRMFAGAAALAILTHASSAALGQQGQAKAKTKAQAQDAKPALREVAIPANPNDPIAMVNGQPITRAELANECVVRRGKEILETLIARRLIEQALKKSSLTVTAAEIDAEINSVARRMTGGAGGRETLLRTLEKERNISPAQYANDIIYPSVALKKLAQSRVKINNQMIQDAFDSSYGDKLRCRIIMTDTLQKAQDIWNRLRKSPGAFERIAMQESLDLNTRAGGGLIPEPIVRHSYPRSVSDAAFVQLVDGDPKDPDYKPKDGDITGPIQATEGSWVILRREAIIPGNPNASVKDEAILKQLTETVREAQLKERMSEVYSELLKTAQIENHLTGHIKDANEDITAAPPQGAPEQLDPRVNANANANSSARDASLRRTGSGDK